MKILLVEREAKNAANLVAFFAADGVRSEVADTAEDALEFVRSYEFDLMLLNLSLPDMDGSMLIKRVRAARKGVPILALAATSNVQQRVAAFSAGADDVVVQSVDPIELLARMRAIVRRSCGYSEAALKLGNLTLYLDRHEVAVDERSVALTGKEFAILHLLVLRKNMVMTKEAILSNIYGGMDEPEPKIIDVFICKLRKKLATAGAPNMIGTVWGRGYTVRDPARDSHLSTRPQTPAPVEHRMQVTCPPEMPDKAPRILYSEKLSNIPTCV